MARLGRTGAFLNRTARKARAAAGPTFYTPAISDTGASFASADSIVDHEIWARTLSDTGSTFASTDTVAAKKIKAVSVTDTGASFASADSIVEHEIWARTLTDTGSSFASADTIARTRSVPLSDNGLNTQLGHTSVGVAASLAFAANKRVQKYTAPATGSLAGVWWYYSGSSVITDTMTWRGVVYRDIGGGAATATFAAVGVEVSATGTTPAGWYFSAFPTPLAVTNGDVLWIGEWNSGLSNSGSIQYYDTGGYAVDTRDGNANVYSSGGNPSDPFGANSLATTTDEQSMYASFVTDTVASNKTSGGTLYNRTATDTGASFASADTILRTPVRRVLSDTGSSFASADSIVEHEVWARTLTDTGSSFASADSIAKQRSVPRTLSDTGSSFGTADAFVSLRTRTFSDSGIATVSDTVVAGRFLPRTATDTGASFASVDTTATSRTRVLTDTGATVTDNNFRGAVRVVTDTGSTFASADSISRLRSVPRTLSDTGITVTETLASSRARVVTDTGSTFASADSISRTRNVQRTLSDTGSSFASADTIAATKLRKVTDTGSSFSSVDSILASHIKPRSLTDSGLALVSSGSVYTDGIAASSNLTGAYTDVDDDPGFPDGNWLTTTTANTQTAARFTFPTSPGTPSGTQTIRVLVRASGGTPTDARIDIYENGSLIQTGATQQITSAVGQVITETFAASSLSDPSGAGVEARVVGGPGI